MKIPGLNDEVKIGWFAKACMKIASADEATLRLCPPHDLSHVKATAELLVCTMLYQATLFAIISHRLFASPGEVRPTLILGSLFVAGFIMLIDAFCVIGSQWHLSGIEEFKRGGLDISGGPVARIKSRIFLLCRILLSIALAQLTAVFVSILVFQADISAETQRVYLQDNAHLIAGATALVDNDIRRASDAVSSQSARVDALSGQVTALRQNEIDPSENPETRQAQEEVAQLLVEKQKADDAVLAAKIFATNELGGIKGTDGNSGLAGNGPRHKAALQQIANAKAFAYEASRQLDAARARLDQIRKTLGTADDATRAQSRDALPEFSGNLIAENRTLSALKAQLGSLTRGREDAIRQAAERAPDHVKLDDGFLAQITALEQIASKDTRIAVIIGLIDVTSFGLELAAVLSMVTSFVPTTYSALIARDAYLRSVNMVDEVMRALDLSAKMADIEFPPRNKPPGSQGLGPVSGPTPGSPPDPPTQPPKRPRGRPRNNPLN